MLGALATVVTLLHLALPQSGVLQNYANQLTSRAANQQPALEVRAKDVATAYAALPVTKPNRQPVGVTARAAMLYDVDSGAVLYERSVDDRMPIASITKVTTALTILQRHKLDEVMTVPTLPVAPFGSELLGIKPGEQFTVNEALHAMLIYSANDMAQALAIWDSGSEVAFAQRMNSYAVGWGLRDSRYVNATGLDEPGEYSSAADVVKLGTILLRNPVLNQIVQTRSYTARNLAGKRYTVTTTNKLLGNGTVYGIKTGYTLAAGQCLLSLGKRGGHDVIGVVLGADDRFAATSFVLNWGFTNYTWE